MNNGDNVTRGRHLEALAGVFLGKLTSVSGAINDILNSFGVFQGATSVRAGTEGLVPAPVAGDEVKFLCGDGTWSTVESGATVLDTVPASVNGGMWYEVMNDMPVVKIYYNGQEYSLGEAEDPNLQVIPSNVTVPHGNVITASVSYDGDGILSLQSTIDGAFYDSDTRQITVPYSPSIDSSSIRVKLAGCPGFTPAEASLNVTMEKLNPNLTVTLETSSTVTATSPATATVYYEGGGEISITSNPNVPWTYENNVITVPYADIAGNVTFTVHVAPNNGYLEATETFTVTMQKLSPNLTVTPSANTTSGDDITATVTYLGSGTITVTSSSASVNPTYNSATNVLTVPYSADVDSAVITVSLGASYGYPADTASFTVNMVHKLDPILTVTPTALATDGVSPNATVTYSGDGTLSVTSNNTGVTPSISGTTITVPYFAFSQNTTVTITVSATEGETYKSAQTSFTVDYLGTAYNAYLNVNMPFDSSVTQDTKGTAWSTSGSPAISNHALSLDGSSALTSGGYNITLGGKDFTIKCWACINPSESNPGGTIFGMRYNDTAWTAYTLGMTATLSPVLSCHPTNSSTTSYPFNISVSQIIIALQWYHYEVVYRHNAKTVMLFIDGSLVGTATNIQVSRVAREVRIGRSFFGNTDHYLKGYIDDFKIYDGVALHTADFTPPARSS